MMSCELVERDGGVAMRSCREVGQFRNSGSWVTRAQGVIGSNFQNTRVKRRSKDLRLAMRDDFGRALQRRWPGSCPATYLPSIDPKLEILVGNQISAH